MTNILATTNENWTGKFRAAFKPRDLFLHDGTSLRRFALTAGAGFVSNEVVFVLLLRWLALPALVALAAALVFAAGQTFLLSRYWAFRR